MRYVSLVIAVTMGLLLTSGCQEDKPQTQPTAKQAPAETMDHAKQEAHEAMDEALVAGQAIYENNCSTCHTTGLAGAPKLGDTAAWAPLNAEGIDQLVHVAIKGEGAMPPRGGNFNLSDEEIHAAVSYMMEKGQ